MLSAATLCSGVGAPETAMPDWNWLWCAEIEAFPSEVLSARFGHKNLGDMAAPDFAERAASIGVPDVIVAGTPCQAFSLAGKRGGLSDDRGNLTLVFTRIIHDLAVAAVAAGSPRPCVLWENVPGVLSQPDNAFGCFLGALVGADDALHPPRGEGWPGQGMVSGPRARLAWRVLDAQHFGLAQRRERVFVVVDFGDGPDPAAVLFEPARGEGDYSPRCKTREKPSAGNPRAAGRGSLRRAVAAAFADPRFGVSRIARTLCARDRGGSDGRHDQLVPEVTHSLTAGGFDASEDGTGRGTPLIPDVAWALQERDAKGADSDTKEGHLIPMAIAMNLRGREGGAMPELDDKASIRAADGGSSRSYLAVFDGGEVVGEDQANTAEVLRLLRQTVGEEPFTQWGLGIAAALQQEEVLRPRVHEASIFSGSGHGHVVGGDAQEGAQTYTEGAVQSLWGFGCDGRPPQGWKPSEQLARQLGTYLSRLPHSGASRAAFLLGLLQASQGIGLLRQALSKVQEVGRSDPDKSQPALFAWQVRRLTPVEAARLQGFPDHHARIAWRGKPEEACPDGPQYKAFGNAMAVPVIRWICRRIEEHRKSHSVPK